MESPRARGLFVLTAHPEGCRVLAQRQVERAAAAFEKPLPGAEGKTALVLGSTSFGYGSSTAIALRQAGFERIIGVGYETAPAFRGEKLAMSSPGWYLTHALHQGDGAFQTYLSNDWAVDAGVVYPIFIVQKVSGVGGLRAVGNFAQPNMLVTDIVP